MSFLRCRSLQPCCGHKKNPCKFQDSGQSRSHQSGGRKGRQHRGWPEQPGRSALEAGTDPEQQSPPRLLLGVERRRDLFLSFLTASARLREGPGAPAGASFVLAEGPRAASAISGSSCELERPGRRAAVTCSVPSRPRRAGHELTAIESPTTARRRRSRPSRRPARSGKSERTSSPIRFIKPPALRAVPRRAVRAVGKRIRRRRGDQSSGRAADSLRQRPPALSSSSDRTSSSKRSGGTSAPPGPPPRRAAERARHDALLALRAEPAQVALVRGDRDVVQGGPAPADAALEVAARRARAPPQWAALPR